MYKCYYCKKETKNGVVIYPRPRGKAIMCITCKIEGLKKLLNQSVNLKKVLERKIINTENEIKECIDTV